MFGRLSAADQRELEGHVQVFLKEKNFEGCGGLIVTEEMKVCIAAQACVLLLHRDTDYYPGLRTILVYPSTFYVQLENSDDHVARLGECWKHGAVVLAWDSVQHGAADFRDGQNVVFHEFAHQLDFEDGQADGAPVLASGNIFAERHTKYTIWARVLRAEYEQLKARTGTGQKTVMDEYGATDPAEFFAVATECFFEKPRQLRRRHPELYEELKGFYKQDPVEWQREIAF